MAYESFRGRGGNAEPSYFDAGGMVSGYATHRSAEPRDTSSARSTSNVRLRSLPHDRMTSSPERPERAEPTGFDNVSPELIAEITERVKRELVEHLNRSGNVEEPPKAPPLQRQPSNKSNSTSSPPPSTRRVYTPPSPTQAQSQTSKQRNVSPPMESVREPAREPFRSPPSSPLDKPSGVRFTDRPPAVRPQPGRTFSTMELSTIDQKWGRLFDNDGHPTPRLGQFLRGLANHIIDDFKPEKSIVIPPAKMADLYASHPLDREPNQLVSIFRAGPNEQLSRFYQDLGCQHHLIQDHSSNAPTIPALTALGFAQWMTINILAYPDEESKRLEKIVLAMPIDADGEMIDGKPERLPKQISRHLLPGREDRNSRKLLTNAVADFLADLGSSSRRKASITNPPLSRHSSTSQARPHPVEIHQVRTSPTSSKAQPIERDRNPYVAGPSTSAEPSSTDEPVKLERDRQPYTAQPGNGKIYNEQNNMNPSKLGRTSSTSRPREPEPVEPRETRHQRAKSGASQNPYIPGARPRGRRTSSPPLKKYSDSTPIELDVPGSKYGPGPPSASSSYSAQSQPASFPPPPPIPPIDIRDNRERRRDDRHFRRGTDEEPRFTGEFNSPKDAEKWDRYQEAREVDRTDRPYERGSVSIDPRDTRDTREASRDSRGAAYEDWYRDKPRAPAHDSYPRNY